MIGYRIKQRMEIWKLSLGMNAEERTEWKTMKKMVSGPKYRKYFRLVAGYLTVKEIEELEMRDTGESLEMPEENAMILPNPHAIGNLRELESRMDGPRRPEKMGRDRAGHRRNEKQECHEDAAEIHLVRVSCAAKSCGRAELLGESATSLYLEMLALRSGMKTS